MANQEHRLSISSFNCHAVAHTVFAVGRFLTAILGIFIKPWRILLVLYIGCIITSALATSLTGPSAAAMVILVVLFESGIFSLIFAISLRGLGSYTKWGSVWLTAGTCGGAVIPTIMYPVQRVRGIQYAYVVIVAAFAFGATMPIYLGTVPAAKKQVDPGRMIERRLSIATQAMSTTSSRRPSRILQSVIRRGKKGGSETSASTDQPSIEHVESNGAPRVTRQQNGDGMDLAPWPD